MCRPYKLVEAVLKVAVNITIFANIKLIIFCNLQIHFDKNNKYI